MISKLSKEGAYRKALEVFYSLAEMDIAVDTAVVNAAISATDRGEVLHSLAGAIGIEGLTKCSDRSCQSSFCQAVKGIHCIPVFHNSLRADPDSQ